MYYPGSKNKDADQLHGYHKAESLFSHRQKASSLTTLFDYQKCLH